MNDNISWGISGDKKRVFISTALGCNYNCKYCYLREIGINGIKRTFLFEDIIEELNKKEYFIPGPQGSIISVGCFSECWDDTNLDTTISIINYFLKKGNYVQLSTKKKIRDKDIKKIVDSIKYKNQLNIFVSLPTINSSKLFEPDIDSPYKRIENLSLNRKYGLNTYIYIKPVLENITLKDKEFYVNLIKKYKVPVIIGSRMVPVLGENCGSTKIGKVLMREIDSNDIEKLTQILSKYTKVYSHSTDVIEEMRKK